MEKTQLVRYPTDQQIYDSGMSRRRYMEEFRRQEKKATIQAQRDKESAEVKAGGFVERSGSRFLSQTEQRVTTVYKGGVEQVEKPAPAVTPSVPIVREPINDAAVRAAYQVYMDTAKSGVERGRALFDYACAVGIEDSHACGFRSQQAIEATYAHIQSEESAIRYGFDKDGSIARKAYASRSLSNNRP
jgi:hypothetical protein